MADNSQNRTVYTVAYPQDGDKEALNFFCTWAAAINNHAGFIKESIDRVNLAEQNIATLFARLPTGYGPVQFAFSIGQSGEFDVYQVQAMKVSST